MLHLRRLHILSVLRSCILQAGVGRVRANLASQVKKGKMTQEGLDAVMKRLTGTLTYDSFKSIDMVRTASAVPAATSLCRPTSPAERNSPTAPKSLQICIQSEAQSCSAVAHMPQRAAIHPFLD